MMRMPPPLLGSPRPVMITALALVLLALSAPPLLAQNDSPKAFQFKPVNDGSLALYEGNRIVLVYNHGIQTREGVPPERFRSTYIHPLYGLDGEVITDDFPKDHFHHRGLFWAWPHVGIDGKEYDLWLVQGIHQRFEKWLRQEVDAQQATLDVQNGWYVGDKKVMNERVQFRVHPAAEDGQAIDMTLTLEPTDRPVSLTGAPGKSYGGLTFRYAPGEPTLITVPEGLTKDDLYMTRLPWADLTRTWKEPSKTSGASLFIHPGHPDFPPTWLTRHYGVLCLGWPGVDGGTLQPGTPITLQYRVWIHRGSKTAAEIQANYKQYVEGLKLPTANSPAPAP